MTGISLEVTASRVSSEASCSVHDAMTGYCEQWLSSWTSMEFASHMTTDRAGRSFIAYLNTRTWSVQACKKRAAIFFHMDWVFSLHKALYTILCSKGIRCLGLFPIIHRNHPRVYVLWATLKAEMGTWEVLCHKRIFMHWWNKPISPGLDVHFFNQPVLWRSKRRKSPVWNGIHQSRKQFTPSQYELIKNVISWERTISWNL